MYYRRARGGEFVCIIEEQAVRVCVYYRRARGGEFVCIIEEQEVESLCVL